MGQRPGSKRDDVVFSEKQTCLTSQRWEEPTSDCSQEKTTAIPWDRCLRFRQASHSQFSSLCTSTRAVARLTSHSSTSSTRGDDPPQQQSAPAVRRLKLMLSTPPPTRTTPGHLKRGSPASARSPFTQVPLDTVVTPCQIVNQIVACLQR